PAREIGRAQRSNLVGGAPHLERSRALQTLGLEEKLCARTRVERFRRQNRRSLDPARQSLPRRRQVLCLGEVHGRHGIQSRGGSGSIALAVAAVGADRSDWAGGVHGWARGARFDAISARKASAIWPRHPGRRRRRLPTGRASERNREPPPSHPKKYAT